MIVRWSLLARHDLGTLRAYIARNNPGAAATVARRITAAANRLGRYPHLGRPGRQPDNRELVVPRTPYRVLSRWGTMLGVDVSSEESAANRAQRLHDHLQTVVPGKPVLIVLDDAWSWRDLAPFRIFAEPGNALPLTTRDHELARRFTQRRLSSIEELDETASVALLARLCPEATIDPERLNN